MSKIIISTYPSGVKFDIQGMTNTGKAFETEGYTPFSSNIPAGKYSINLRKKFYIPFIEEFEIEDDQEVILPIALEFGI